MKPTYYVSEKGYFYIEFQGIVSRISQDLFIQLTSQNTPKKGDLVQIIVKPYKLKKLVIGRVLKVLTNKKSHPRGIKIMLENGTVGRLVQIIKYS